MDFELNNSIGITFSDFDYCTMVMYKNVLVLRKFMLKYLQIKEACIQLSLK